MLIRARDAKYILKFLYFLVHHRGVIILDVRFSFYLKVKMSPVKQLHFYIFTLTKILFILNIQLLEINDNLVDLFHLTLFHSTILSFLRL